MSKVNAVSIIFVVVEFVLIFWLVTSEKKRLAEVDVYLNLRAQLSKEIRFGVRQSELIENFKGKGFIPSTYHHGPTGLGDSSDCPPFTMRDGIKFVLVRGIPRRSCLPFSATSDWYFVVIFDEHGRLQDYYEGQTLNSP